MPPRSLWAIVPVKRLEISKSRLRSVLSPRQRHTLTRTMLMRLLGILRHMPDIEGILVVSRDAAVAELAAAAHCHLYSEPPLVSLNEALAGGLAYAQAQGASHALILPTDLPLVEEVDVQNVVGEAGDSAVVICSDKRHDGTNALLLPLTKDAFQMQYGRRSFHKHQQEAARLGWPLQVVEPPRLQFDLDTAEDWHSYQRVLLKGENIGGC